MVLCQQIPVPLRVLQMPVIGTSGGISPSLYRLIARELSFNGCFQHLTTECLAISLIHVMLQIGVEFPIYQPVRLALHLEQGDELESIVHDLQEIIAMGRSKKGIQEFYADLLHDMDQ